MRFDIRGSRLGLAISVFLVWSAASAQQTSPFPGVPTKMIVTVEAHHGKQVPNVRKEDVVVAQGKQRDEVVAWQPVSQVGSELFLLIDDSLSPTDLGTKLKDIASFINSQPANTMVGVAYMRDGAAVIAQQLTSDHSQAAKALRLPVGDIAAGSSPYFALEDLMKRWPAKNGVREVVMISDGIDRFWGSQDLNNTYLNSAIEEAQRLGVVVSALYAHGAGHFGHTFWRINSGQNFLSRLADETGGEAYFLGNDSPVSFAPYFKELNGRMGSQFLLTFLAQPGKKSGLERIKLTTEVPNAELVAPTQVYVSIS